MNFVSLAHIPARHEMDMHNWPYCEKHSVEHEMVSEECLTAQAFGQHFATTTRPSQTVRTTEHNAGYVL